MLDLDRAGQLFPGDLFFPEGGTAWLSLPEARAAWSRPAVIPTKKRRHRVVVTLMLLLVLAIVALIAVQVWPRESNLLVTGQKADIGNIKLDSAGGRFQLDVPGQQLDGMVLDVPGDAFHQPVRLQLSASPVTEHRLGSGIRIVSPLIRISGCPDYTGEPLLLTVPIELDPDEFAMGFYYDRRSGALEGIPLTELTSSQITLATRHFSNLIILATDMAALLSGEARSDFLPGADDWQFTNFGSYLAPGGHCAGQSVTAMFYYSEIHHRLGEPRLFGRFDNNLETLKTPNFWQDDVWGYRFASVAQQSMAWGSLSSRLQLMFGNISDIYSMASFAFALRVTGQPQFVYVASILPQADGSPSGAAHAMIVYRYSGGKLYIADPNFPGHRDREIIFSPLSGFAPYSSGANGKDIQTGGAILFDQVNYIGASALFDFSALQKQYQAMLKGQIGAN